MPTNERRMPYGKLVASRDEAHFLQIVVNGLREFTLDGGRFFYIGDLHDDFGWCLRVALTIRRRLGYTRVIVGHPGIWVDAWSVEQTN